MGAGWAPRSLPGGVYCSPRCGGQCKRADFDRVTKAAAALAKRMGEGWKPVVWENLGWHYKVEKGILEISVHRDGSYSAWFQGTKQFIAEAGTPEDALGFLTQDVRTFARQIENELAEVAS